MSDSDSREIVERRLEERCVPEPNSGCLLWTGGLTTSGYGSMMYRGKVHRTHRLAYEFAYGPIPKGMQVLHRCDTRTCNNPHHLFVGTNADNMRDRNEKGRQARGVKNGNAKLTETMVMQIYRAEGSYASIGRQYGITGRAVSQIKKGQRWSWLTHD